MGLDLDNRLLGNWNKEHRTLEGEEYKMTFNLKKAQVINNSVTPQSIAVPSHSKKYNLSFEGNGSGRIIDAVSKIIEELLP